MRLAAEEASTENPLSSQASALMQFEKDKLAEKNKDQKWCTEKINPRKLRWPITSVSLKVERATKKKIAKILITVERSNHHRVTHLAGRLEIYGYSEWLGIKEALKKVRSPYRRSVEDKLGKLINRVSQHTKLPTIATKVPSHPSSSKKKDPQVHGHRASFLLIL